MYFISSQQFCFFFINLIYFYITDMNMDNSDNTLNEPSLSLSKQILCNMQYELI